MPKPSYIVTIDPELAGQRVDNFLLTRLKGVPKSRIYRIIRKGEVRVNKKRIEVSYRLVAGDLLRIPPIRVAAIDTPQRIPDTQIERIESAILYEDAGLIVVNKPSGIAVHGGSGVSLGVIESFRLARPQAKFLELVHRLDKGTSGCLLIAKKRAVLIGLHEALKTGQVKKTYHTLVMGQVKSARRIDVALRKFECQGGERMVKVDPENGKTALTEFNVLANLNGATLLSASPITGRTHQIRVHARHMGHPIAGDDKYGEVEFNARMKKMGLTRLFLHAAKLSFPLPHQPGEWLTIEAPLDKKLTALIEGLS